MTTGNMKSPLQRTGRLVAAALLSSIGLIAFASEGDDSNYQSYNTDGGRLVFTDNKEAFSKRSVIRFYRKNRDLKSLSDLILVPGEKFEKTINIGSNPNAKLQLVSKRGGSDDSFYGLVQTDNENNIVADSIQLKVNGKLVISDDERKLDITSNIALFDAGTEADTDNEVVTLSSQVNQFGNGAAAPTVDKSIRVSIKRVRNSDSKLKLTIAVPRSAKNALYEIVYAVSGGDNLLYSMGKKASRGLELAAELGNTDGLREELLRKLASLGKPVGVVGGVYTMTNDAENNAVTVFDRYIDGHLEFRENVSSNGNGYAFPPLNIDPFESQGAIVTSDFGRFVVGLNAGSNEVFVMRVNRQTNELEFADEISSHGELPISVAIHRNLIYVVNAGTRTISGYKINREGHLRSIRNSVRTLGPGNESLVAFTPDREPYPHEIQFTPKGDKLVVLESGTNSDVIYIFPLDENGVAGERVTTPSDSEYPLAMSFSPNGSLLVTSSNEDETLNVLTSYKINDDSSLSIITPAIPNHQAGSCWLVTRGAYAYTINSFNNTFSFYAAGEQGDITLVDPVEIQLLNGDGPFTDEGTLDEAALAELLAAGTAPPFPTDAAINTSGHYLYSLDVGNGTISGFSIAEDGNLAFLDEYHGGVIPYGGSQGLAAR